MIMISLTGPRHAGMFCLCSHPLLPQKEYFQYYCLTNRQTCSLEDYIEISIMLQCSSINILLTNCHMFEKNNRIIGDLARIIG